MKKIIRRVAGYLPFILCLLLLYSIPVFSSFVIQNFFIQLFVFILSSVMSILNLYQNDQKIYWALVFLCLLYISRIMYTTLVDYTGARPSEYYSVKKRPAYKEYQKTTNMFFPGPVRFLDK